METNSLSFMQRNLRHIWGKKHDALPSPPHPTFGGDVSPLSPAGFTPLVCCMVCYSVRVVCAQIEMRRADSSCRQSRWVAL